jgi:hypothetical protein
MKVVSGKVAVVLAILGLFVLGVPSVAKADTVTYNLNVGSTLPSQQYGTIKLTVNGSGGIDVVITLNAGNRIIQTGQDVSMGFNSSLSPDPTIAVSGLPAGYALISTTPGSLGADGFGSFEYGLSSTFGANDLGAASTLSFTVTKAGGFSSVANLVELSTNPPGSIQSFFAIDIFCTSCNNGTGATGFIGTNGVPVTSPEPVSVLLLGSGLMGLGLAGRRLRRS